MKGGAARRRHSKERDRTGLLTLTSFPLGPSTVMTRLLMVHVTLAGMASSSFFLKSLIVEKMEKSSEVEVL